MITVTRHPSQITRGTPFHAVQHGMRLLCWGWGHRDGVRRMFGGGRWRQRLGGGSGSNERQHALQ